MGKEISLGFKRKILVEIKRDPAAESGFRASPGKGRRSRKILRGKRYRLKLNTYFDFRRHFRVLCLGSATAENCQYDHGCEDRGLFHDTSAFHFVDGGRDPTAEDSERTS